MTVIESSTQSIEDLVEIENTPTDKFEIRDAFEKGTPIFDDNYRDGNQVYSSTLSIMKGVRNAVLKHAQLHFDRSLQYGVISPSDDVETDFRQFRKVNKGGNNIVLPSFAISLKDYAPIYSPSYNTRRYQCFFYDEANRMVTYNRIPMKFEMDFRYYCDNYDVLLRFRENLNFNSQISFKIDGFSYKTIGADDEEVTMDGHIYFKVNDKSMGMTKHKLEDLDKGKAHSLSVKLDVWANILSKPYLTNIIKSPRVNIIINNSTVKTFINK